MPPASNRDDNAFWTDDQRKPISSSNGGTVFQKDNDHKYNNYNDDTTTSSTSSNEHADTTMTTFDIYPSTDSTKNNNNTSSSSNTPNNKNHTAAAAAAAAGQLRWTRYLPEAYGIRQSVESSKYRWCARESALWGIATGTAMALHRIRMNSPISRVINVGFTTVFIVMGGSYYFCVKRRDYQEQMIELLMKLNTFEPVQNMPAERPIDQTHPFVLPNTTSTTANNNDNDDPHHPNASIPTKQYVAHIPERKEWQTPIPTQDAADIFQPYTTTSTTTSNNGDNDTTTRKK